MTSPRLDIPTLIARFVFAIFSTFGTFLNEVADGKIQLLKSDGSNGGNGDIGTLFGSADVNGVGIFRAGAGVAAIRSGTNSAAALQVSQMQMFSAPSNTTGVGIGGTVAATVGAAGGASALPATPLGYIICNVANVQVKIPYYNT